MVQLISGSTPASEVTVPLPLPAPTTVRRSSADSKPATTRAESARESSHDAVPLQPPPQPVNRLPCAAAALSVTLVPAAYTALHDPVSALPSTIRQVRVGGGPTVVATVPLPCPDPSTVSRTGFGGRTRSAPHAPTPAAARPAARARADARTRTGVIGPAPASWERESGDSTWHHHGLSCEVMRHAGQMSPPGGERMPIVSDC